MAIYYTAVTRFDSSAEDEWNKFINWSGLFNMTETITLDCSLCPSLFLDLQREDWDFICPEVVFPDMFNNLDWVIKRTEQKTDRVILAIFHQPTQDCRSLLSDQRFEFCGYDLMEDDTRISALVNCKGFDKAFSNSELNSSGLISDFDRAKEIQDLLKEHYPLEHHAQCSIWAMWKMKIA